MPGYEAPRERTVDRLRRMSTTLDAILTSADAATLEIISVDASVLEIARQRVAGAAEIMGISVKIKRISKHTLVASIIP